MGNWGTNSHVFLYRRKIVFQAHSKKYFFFITDRCFLFPMFPSSPMPVFMRNSGRVVVPRLFPMFPKSTQNGKSSSSSYAGPSKRRHTHSVKTPFTRLFLVKALPRVSISFRSFKYDNNDFGGNSLSSDTWLNTLFKRRTEAKISLKKLRKIQNAPVCKAQTGARETQEVFR